MAILPVTTDDVEFFTTIINPKRTYVSSSVLGVTGSVNVFARFSKIEKEVRPLSNFSFSTVNDEDIELYRQAVLSVARQTPISGSFFTNIEDYLEEINQQPSSIKKQKSLDIIRFTPSVSFTSNTVKKLNVKEMLMPYYRMSYPTAQWAYTNYHSLNFFSTQTVPTSSVLLYPSLENKDLPEHVGYVSGTYALSGAFSFDFHINPRYKKDEITQGHFRAGTIFHLSSSYALSLITGSAKDENGLPAYFRLMLQLSHSADVAPSRVVPGTHPNDLVFLSDDNSLEWNKWHRVVVRWGTNLINDGTGSFNINGVDKGVFVIPSGTIMPKVYSSKDDPNVLCLGNFYEGINTGDESQAYFFSDISSTREGLEQLVDSGGSLDQPDYYRFEHPLKAELHTAMIRRDYLNDRQILESSASNPGVIDPKKIAFYVPPFFIENTNIRRYTNAPSLGGKAYGGILQTPFFEIDGSTDDPFNVAMAFGVNGHYINLENFTKDFANNVFPRLHHLSGTALDYTTEAVPANEFLYGDSFVRKRNLTILPCDDGTFHPDYQIIKNEINNKALDAWGRIDLSIINLDNLLSTSSLLFGKTHNVEYDPTLSDQQIGYTPENPGYSPGSAVVNAKQKIEGIIATDEGSYGPGVQRDVPLTIFQRLKDPSSNQVTFFEISNLFYGGRIMPGSFEITDASLSGSNGAISIKLKDDGFGNIYRADSLTPHCTWNSVGNIFYDEGIVLIKSPHLYFFGKEAYNMSFRGEQKLFTSKYEILAPRGFLNSSSNPSYIATENSISASLDLNDKEKFVYISGINFHDENLNVVAKASLAQPIMKREGERILFKITFDF